MARTVAQGFEAFLSRLTPTSAQREAGAGHRASLTQALESRLAVARILETGSFNHGTGIRGHSDVDALVSLGADRPGSSITALNWVKDALNARFPLTPVKIRRPAVVAEFGAGFETWEVIPGFITGRGGTNQFVYDVPRRRPVEAGLTPRREHLAYVNEANKNPSKGDAKALARLLKAWKYYRRVPICSFYLEMRAAQHVRRVSTNIHVWDLCEVLESLDAHQLSAMKDPMGAPGASGPARVIREGKTPWRSSPGRRSERDTPSTPTSPTSPITPFLTSTSCSTATSQLVDGVAGKTRARCGKSCAENRIRSFIAQARAGRVTR
jgi:hypothetical protein